MPEGGGSGPSYRDELAAAYQRLAQLEARNHELEAGLARQGDAPDGLAERVRDLEATVRRWDRVRATLATLLGLSGLFALRVAETWSVRAALLASCAAMVVVGITLAWPRAVRGHADPKPHALDVSRPWRRRRRGRGQARRAIAAPAESALGIRVALADDACAPSDRAEYDAAVCASADPGERRRH